MKKFKTFSAGILMLVTFLSFGTGISLVTSVKEEKTITGTVVDNSKLPLPMVTVVNRNTKAATNTDVDGKYSIKAKTGDVLEFTFVGFVAQKITVGALSKINVMLKEDANSLDEVVVVGYEKYDKKSSVVSALQTRVAGVSISSNSEMNYSRDDITNRQIYGGKTIPSPNDEDYGKLIENPFTSPKSEPLSTFSIDVDNASYSNIRRFLNNGQRVPVDAVRTEEMVNFFKYDYPQPQNNRPFSINTEYSDCPWNTDSKLLRIGLQGKVLPTENLPASNLVFLIDVSGSMQDMNKLPLLKESLKVLTKQLRDEDRVSMVVYAGAAGLVLPPTSGKDKKTIIAALDKLEAGGSTAGGAGIELAYKTAQEHFIKGGNNRVILATDGDFNVGSSSNSDMETLIEQKRKSGVFLTVLGYGMGNYKDSKMEILSDKGNGNYAYIDNIQEANRFLGKEFKGSMFAIAKDVKIQIEFNPEFVQSYKLIGYENRKLRPEDFVNDAIDAGELGSGHTVTALYEIVPTGVKSPFVIDSANLKYTKTETSLNKFPEELATLKFRYKKPDGDVSTEISKVVSHNSVPMEKASADMKFVSAVAWFGLVLRESKYIQSKSVEAIRELASQGLTKDPDGYKAEFIRLTETPAYLAQN
ncbi:vWA domain-containing protein [Flavobacterium silvaticum]|uniref:DUF3520 domain-containing protein n=1 Tax=Flavobacterium silvaticum TaxID=1852020 RepID=A0A972FP80_9FLAO|nr:VWA domain-containing protein [Flavobacterium silvaticum]NMH29313.1 DUF3520 domain-containing protein [Flavobacterium silvaticum]